MKRMMLCLCLFLALAAPCAAQNASGPFTDVRLGTWPYAAVETLQEAGITVGYPDGTYGGRRVLTRYDFAVSAARLMAQMSKTGAANPQTDCDKLLRKSPLAVNAGLALLEEFSLELEKLKQDVPSALNLLITLQHQQRQEISMGKIVLTPDQLQSPFADLQNPDPSWHDTDVLQKEGIVLGYPEGTGGRLPSTRLHAATFLVRLFSHLPFSPDVATRLQQNAKELPALTSLVRNFSPELKLLGADADVYQKQLKGIEKTVSVPNAIKHGTIITAGTLPFADVPISHWAAASVESLRLHGIVVGYGNGKFSVSQ